MGADQVKDGITLTSGCVQQKFSSGETPLFKNSVGRPIASLLWKRTPFFFCDRRWVIFTVVSKISPESDRGGLCLALALTYIPGTGLPPLKHAPENSNGSQLELPAILLVMTKWKGSSQENFKKTYGMTDDASHQECQGQVNPPLPEGIQIWRKVCTNHSWALPSQQDQKQGCPDV